MEADSGSEHQLLHGLVGKSLRKGFKVLGLGCHSPEAQRKAITCFDGSWTYFLLSQACKRCKLESLPRSRCLRPLLLLQLLLLTLMLMLLLLLLITATVPAPAVLLSCLAAAPAPAPAAAFATTARAPKLAHLR